MSGRGLAVGTVRPVLRDRPGIVRPVHDIGVVGPTGRRVDRVAAAPVRSERAVAHHRRADVDHRRARLEAGAGTHDVHDPFGECRICDQRRRPGVEGEPGRGGSGDRERLDTAPLGALVDLLAAEGWQTLGVQRRLQRQRLPAVGVDHHGAGLGDLQRRVRGTVGRILVVVSFQGAIVGGRRQHAPGDAHSERGRAVRVDPIAVVEAAGLGEDRPERHEGLGSPHRIGVTLPEDDERSQRDGVVARSGRIAAGGLLVDEHRGRSRVERRPRIPHRRREMVEIPRVFGRSGVVPADRRQGQLVPDTCGRARAFERAVAGRHRAAVRVAAVATSPDQAGSQRAGSRGDRQYHEHAAAPHERLNPRPDRSTVRCPGRVLHSLRKLRATMLNRGIGRRALRGGSLPPLSRAS